MKWLFLRCMWFWFVGWRNLIFFDKNHTKRCLLKHSLEEWVGEHAETNLLYQNMMDTTLYCDFDGLWWYYYDFFLSCYDCMRLYYITFGVCLNKKQVVLNNIHVIHMLFSCFLSRKGGNIEFCEGNKQLDLVSHLVFWVNNFGGCLAGVDVLWLFRSLFLYRLLMFFWYVSNKLKNEFLTFWRVLNSNMETELLYL